MAKVVNPLLSVEARGRMGGLVFNTWHGISYVKAFSSPNQPNTQKQLDARALLAAVSADWQALTQSQRDAWSVYADANLIPDWTGNPKRITAQNWYVKCNAQLARMGESLITDPPAAVAPDAPVGFEVTELLSDISVAWTAPVTGTLQLEFKVLGPVSPGVDPKIERAVFLSFLEPDALTPATVVVGAANGRWRIWARVADEATGLVSPWVSDTVDVS